MNHWILILLIVVGLPVVGSFFFSRQSLLWVSLSFLRLVSLRGIDSREDDFEFSRQPHDLSGPDHFMELGLDKRVGPVDFIKQSRLRMLDRERGGDKVKTSFG